MGIRSYVRGRQQVKADRAESGSHQKLVETLGRGSVDINPILKEVKNAGAMTSDFKKIMKGKYDVN